MTWGLRILWFLLGQHAKMRMARQIKRTSVVAYLRALQGARRVLLGALLLFFFLQTVVLAGVGAVATGLWLWDYDPHVKLEIAFGLCLTLFILPVALICVLFSERLWYRFSGAEKMVEDLVAPDESKVA